MNADHEKLAELSTWLKRSGLPTQKALALGAGPGVDQALVSRARNGELRRFKGRVIRLHDYVSMRIAELGDAEASVSAGDDDAAVDDAARSRALMSCRRYLDEGCDPQVLVDQLVILRRAQRTNVGRRPRAPTA
jgi:hypothetical protein